MAIIKFLVNNIKMGKTTYEQVVSSRPDLKEAIDKYIEKKISCGD